MRFEADVGRPSLRPSEIETCFGIPKRQVELRLKDATYKFRLKTLLDTIAKNEVNEIEYISHSSVCVVCGSRCNPKVRIPIVDTNLMYCSSLCASKKPAVAIKLELMYGTDAGVILTTALRTFKDFSIIASCFNTGADKVKYLYKSMLGVDVDLFFQYRARQSTKKLITSAVKDTCEELLKDYSDSDISNKNLLADLEYEFDQLLAVV